MRLRPPPRHTWPKAPNRRHATSLAQFLFAEALLVEDRRPDYVVRITTSIADVQSRGSGSVRSLSGDSCIHKGNPPRRQEVDDKPNTLLRIIIAAGDQSGDKRDPSNNDVSTSERVDSSQGAGEHHDHLEALTRIRLPGLT